jgi:hypothetical protein
MPSANGLGLACTTEGLTRMYAEESDSADRSYSVQGTKPDEPGQHFSQSRSGR